VRGENRDEDEDLPEIPALEGRAAVRYEAGEGHPWWCELGARIADGQERVFEAFPEDPTPGYTVCHLRGGVQITESFALQAGIENLLDKEYWDHLTREAAVAVGDLAAGDEIPAPERSFYLTVRATF